MKDIEIKTRRVGKYLAVDITIAGFRKNIGLYDIKETKELLGSLDNTRDELVEFIGGD